jgi:hypothetical protein
MATCVAETPALYAILNTFDSSTCTVDNANSYRLACNADGDIVRMLYTGQTCSTFNTNTTPASAGSSYSPCTLTNSFYSGSKCFPGKFTPPAPMIFQYQFTDASCTMPQMVATPTVQSIVYPIGVCIDQGPSQSVKITCSGGKPTTTTYGATKCTGASTATESFSTDCTKDKGTGPASYSRYAPCVSSGAASTSVTFLALGLLVLATFSSAM